MLKIHATKKLYAKLVLDENGLLVGRSCTAVDSKPERVYDWTAHILIIKRRQCLLLVHHETRFPVFIPAVRKPNLANLDRIFEDVFLNTLLKIGLSQKAFELVGDSLSPMQIDSRTDRSVLGTITQFKYVLEWICQDYDLDETTGYSINRALAFHLCKAKGNPDYIVPAVEMAKWLGESKEACARIDAGRISEVGAQADEVHLIVLNQYLECYSTDDGVRNISELHGFLTGVLLCKRVVLPSEWVPAVWGGEEFSPQWQHIEQAAAFQNALMKFYNEVAEELLVIENFEPLFAEYSEQTGRGYSTPWCYGFVKGVMLDETQDLSSEDAQMAMSIISMPFNPTFAKQFEANGEIIEEHCKQVKVAILAMHHVNHGAGGDQGALVTSNVVPFKREPRVGRNDLCSCGSGKKYKKCCLLLN